jgi:pheromone shutdown protein TraB
MAKESTEAIAKILRDIQTTLAEHTKMLKEQGAVIKDMRREMAKREVAPSNEPDRLSELLDEFEKLSPEEQRRDIERAGEFLRVHGMEGLDRLDELLPAREELK